MRDSKIREALRRLTLSEAAKVVHKVLKEKGFNHDDVEWVAMAILVGEIIAKKGTSAKTLMAMAEAEAASGKIGLLEEDRKALVEHVRAAIHAIIDLHEMATVPGPKDPQ